MSERKIPSDCFVDSTYSLMKDPYRYIGRRCRELRSDVFQTRLLLQRTICFKGHEAAKLFYQPEYFERNRAAPGRSVKTLFGKNGVQLLDGEAHRHRKLMLLNVLRPERAERLTALIGDNLLKQAGEWEQQNTVCLYNEFKHILCDSACNWAGVPVPVSELEFRTRLFSSLYENAGSLGPRYWNALTARKIATRWAITQIKKNRGKTSESAVSILANHTDKNGELLTLHAAATELLNLIHPIIAVSVYVTFSALALHSYPWCRIKLRGCSREFTEAFVEEVRRFYPVFPFIAARTTRDFVWKELKFPAKTRVLLDLHGTNHDPNIWSKADVFDPSRFLNCELSMFELIPQGGGDPLTSHRCPGELITSDLMKLAINFLMNGIVYNVPDQNLLVNYRKLPALPESKFMIKNVRLIPSADYDKARSL